MADAAPAGETVLCMLCLRPMAARDLAGHLTADHGPLKGPEREGAQAPSRPPSPPEVMRAASLMAAGSAQGALEALEAAVERDPHAEEAWFQKGMLHIARREFAEALMCLERATALDGHDPRAWVAKFFALERVGSRSAEAARCLIKAADLDPLFTQRWIAERFTEDELVEIRKRYSGGER